MNLKNRLLPLVTILIIFTVWYIAAALYGIELILPKPTAALKELWAALKEPAFWKGVGNTMLRSVLAFIIAFFEALSVGFKRSIFQVVLSGGGNSPRASHNFRNIYLLYSRKRLVQSGTYKFSRYISHAFLVVLHFGKTMRRQSFRSR